MGGHLSRETPRRDTTERASRRRCETVLPRPCAAQVAGTLEGTWIATYFLDSYPYYADLYAYLTAFVITIGIGFFFLLVAGWAVDQIVISSPFGVPTLLVIPGVALMVGAPCKLVPIIVTSNFPLGFTFEAIGKAFDTFNEAPLYVALQLAAPASHRPTVVGMYLFLYWVFAATIAELINDAFGLDIYQVLFIACAVQLAGGLGYNVLACTEYPRALKRAADAAQATGTAGAQRPP